jgi:hypothetical protein
VKATPVARKTVKKKKEPETPPSRSSDNEGDLSFVDYGKGPEEEPNPFIKRSHYSASKEKKKRARARERARIPSSSESGDEDDSDMEDDDADADVDEEEAAKEEDPSLFKRKDGKDLEYKDDEFIDLSEEELKERNARRLLRGKSELKRPEALSESDEGEQYMYRSPPDSSSSPDADSDSSSSSSELMEAEDSRLLDPMDVDKAENSEDETSALLKDAGQFLKVAEHRIAPTTKRRETSRSALARESANELLPAAEIDSEADTVDPNQRGDLDDDDDELANNAGSALMNVYACVVKEFAALASLAPDDSFIMPLEIDNTAELFEAVKTLTAIHFNAAVEQQKSKTIQADINKGHSNISGQSTSIKQSESAQNALHFLNDFTCKDKILALIAGASENVA